MSMIMLFLAKETVYLGGNPPIRPWHHMNTLHADVGYRTPVTAVKGENNRHTEILVRGIRVSTKSASTSLYIKERFV